MGSRGRFLPGAAGLLLATAVGIAARLPQSERVDGEYGLWVEDRADSLVVHWLTGEKVPGIISIGSQDGRVNAMKETPAGLAHRFAIAKPRVDELQIVYGNKSTRFTTKLRFTQQPRRFSASNVDSLYVLGDTHGEFDRVAQLLRHAGLVDHNLHWTGGHKTLVFDGDLMDRGPDATRLLWFVYNLENEAQLAGGRIHVLLGNHEIMVMLNDVRYLHEKEQKLAQLHGVGYSKMYDIRESLLGKWLARKPAVLRIDQVLFAHGGVSDQMLKLNLKAIDDTLAAYMSEELFYRWSDTTAVIRIDSASYARRTDFFWDPNSVFWFRGYVQTDTLGTMLDRVLDHYGSTLHVVGHTASTEIHSRYAGKLIASHPRQPALEMLLLLKEGKSYRAIKYDLNGSLTPVPAAK